MTAGRPRTDYVGQKFGLVTVIRRDGSKLWCRCECGSMRHFDAGNLISHPPKAHSRCDKFFQYELPLDYVRQPLYKSAS
jgi:hypothetical protein